MPTLAPRRALRVLAACALLAACSERPDFTPGTECELNTECAAPLVCRLGRCRVECRARRDCAAGLECVRDDRGLGVCQLREETECERNSDCPDPLVCRFGSCTNACVDDRDCISGARCVASPDGGRACRDQAEEQCERNSDCPEPYICAADEHCREECREDRDCRDGNVCLVGVDPPVCGPPEMRPDGGPGPDGGTDMDAALGDDGGTPADGGAPTDGSSGGGGPVTPPAPPLMAGGADHTCTQTTTPAGLHCFGNNANGRIGNGSITGTSETPYAHSIPDVRVVGAGGSHSCVATSTSLFCWGDNGVGQIGLGSMGGEYASPTEVTTLPGAPTDLALGQDHTCAIVSDRLFCWGGNGSGQLGDGSTTSRPTPTEVDGLGGVPAQVAAFSVHTCVRLTTGHVECWGDNGGGRLGLGDSVDRHSPTRVPGFDDAVQIAVGSTHSCAVRASGTVECWGDNTWGQVGDGTMGSPIMSPTAVSGISEPVLQVALGSAHTCARTANQVWCWGNNFSGQNGIDDATTSFLLMPRATTIGIVDEVAAGSNHTCVRVAGTSVRCFGDNASGQLGRGTTGSWDWMPMEVAWP